jgi:O-methyltransferase involved in polyketide biosynthesis
MPDFDPRTPSIARVYDYLMGGKDNFAADRELADRLIAMDPSLVENLPENRKFLARAVTWVANQGVTQFIDLGAGMPTAPSTYESALAADPSATVVLVDNDPVVLSHLRALVAKGNPGVAVLDADLGQAEKILSLAEEHADLDEPVCLIMGFVLHFLDASAAAALVRAYTTRLSPGSYVVISTGYGNTKATASLHDTYNAEGFAVSHNHGPAELASFFDGLEMVPPGIAQAQEWRADWPELPRSPDRDGQVLVGIGRVRS